MRSAALALVALLAGCGSHKAVSLRYDPPPGTLLQRSVAIDARMELRDAEVRVNGEPRPELAKLSERMAPSFMPGGVETWELADEVVRVEGGRPAELVRTVRALRGGTGLTAGWTDALDGRRFPLTPEADPIQGDGGVVPFDLDLAAALPDGPVRKGDTWRVPAGAVELVEDELGERWRREVECTFAGWVPGSSGRRVRIELAFDESREVEDPDAALMRRDEAEKAALETFREDARCTLAGELVWDLERQHAAALDVRTELVVEVELRAAPADAGPVVETRSVFAFSSHVTQTIRSTLPDR